ncbi:hypothetical protein ACFV6E_12340 [Streptomyces sp. NPDC059785]
MRRIVWATTTEESKWLDETIAALESRGTRKSQGSRKVRDPGK